MTTQPPDLKKLREVCDWHRNEARIFRSDSMGSWVNVVARHLAMADTIDEAIDAYEASARDAEAYRSALDDVMPFVITNAVEHCDGTKCREMWCIGCMGEETAMETVDDANRASAKAYGLLNAARHATQGD